MKKSRDFENKNLVIEIKEKFNKCDNIQKWIMVFQMIILINNLCFSIKVLRNRYIMFFFILEYREGRKILILVKNFKRRIKKEVQINYIYKYSCIILNKIILNYF